MEANGSAKSVDPKGFIYDSQDASTDPHRCGQGGLSRGLMLAQDKVTSLCTCITFQSLQTVLSWSLHVFESAALHLLTSLVRWLLPY